VRKSWQVAQLNLLLERARLGQGFAIQY